MARRARDYRAEYRARTARSRGIPRSVARGHGALPADVAQRAERGQLSSADRRRYRSAIREYEQRWGPVGSGHAGRERSLPIRFSSYEDAADYVESEYGLDPDSDYVDISEGSGGWTVTLLR